MKKIILVVLLSCSFVYSDDYVMPFVGVENNIFSVGKVTFENKKLGFVAGLIVQNDNKISLSKFIGVQNEADASHTTYTVDSVDINYGYSFNNYGEQRGFNLSTGVERIILTTDYDSVNSNGTKERIFDLKSSFNLMVGAGYEYKINSNYIVDVHHFLRVYELGGKTNMKRVYNTKFALKYIFN